MGKSNSIISDVSIMDLMCVCAYYQFSSPPLSLSLVIVSREYHLHQPCSVIWARWRRRDGEGEKNAWRGEGWMRGGRGMERGRRRDGEGEEGGNMGSA